MRQDKLLLFIAVVALSIAFLAAAFTYFSVGNLVLRISGYGTTGYTNLTVETLASVNFTTHTINWGSGRVSAASTAASLTTYSTGNVTGGNWTLTTAGGLRLENDGNVNVSVNLTVNKNASEFISGTSPAFEWNLTISEAGSCLNGSGKGGVTGSGLGGLRINSWFPANTTTSQQAGGGGALFCHVLRFENANDEVRLDFNVTVPQDSASGALTTTITATAVAFNPA